MSRLRILAAKMRAIIARGRVERELDEELRSHYEMLVEENVRRGMSAEEARRAARQELGGAEQIKEAVHEQRGLPVLESIAADVRYAMRMLRKSPGFTTMAVLTLALGIGANTAIFGIVDAVLLRPLPYKNPQRLTIIWQSDAAHRKSGAWFDTYREFQEWQKQSTSFEKLAAFTWAHVDTTIRLQGKPERVVGIPVTADFFSTLGVEAAYGRTFTAEDSRNACTAVLSNGFWRGELGSARVVGRTLTVNDQLCLVAGIMPKDFSFYPKETQLWILIPPDGEFAEHPWDAQVGVLGVLNPGVTRGIAEAELTALQERIIHEAPKWVPLNSGPDALDLQFVFIWLTGRNLRSSLVMLFAAVTFVLLIACVNVATLFAGRAAERQRELGVRAALGASRFRTMRQLLTESLLLSISGATLGVLLARAAIRYLNATNPADLPPGNPIGVNWQVLGFTALVAILSAALFGLMPAWKASRYDLNELLKTSGRSSHRASTVFVVSEVALSLVLLAGAALMIQSLFRLGRTPLGFEPAQLLTANIDLPSKTYAKAEQRRQFYDSLKGNVLSLPGVQGAAFAPFVSSRTNRMSVQGKSGPYHGAVGGDISTAGVDADYFRVMEIPLMRGRTFDARDQEKTAAVAIINEALAQKYLRGDPIGQHIKLGEPDAKEPWLTIVGVVGDVKTFTVFKEMGYVIDACVYRPLAQTSAEGVALFVRSTENPGILGPEIRQAFSQVDGNLPAPELLTMNDWLAQFLTQPRFRAILLAIFAAVGLALCSVGIFGVISQSVTQQRREIGIRMALGAQQGATLRLILREGLSLAVGGVIIGAVGALLLTRLISGLLYGVTATDPATLAGVAVLLVLVAAAACYIPARRAMRVDPMVALRYE